MTTNPLQQSLKSLLPSTISIPPHLLSAADSLLSVSRQRASNLKPDEEIARVHACAEIACKRLRAHLRLPNIKSGNGAPCRPAIYKRLVTFLEGTLGDVDLLGTPSKRNDAQRTPNTGRSTGRKRGVELLVEDDGEDVVETPSKRRKVAEASPLATPTRSGGKNANSFLGRIQSSSSKGKEKGEGSEAPAYVLPAVRKLCKAFKTPQMVPHVYTGVCVSLTLSDSHSSSEKHNQPSIGGPQESKKILKVRHLCLVLAIFAVTLTRMHEGEITQETFDAVSEHGLSTLALGDQEDHSKKLVEEWIGRITTWTSEVGSAADWIDSVPLNTLAAFQWSTSYPNRTTSTEFESGIDGIGGLDAGPAMLVPDRRNGHSISRKEEIRRELEKEDPEGFLLPGLGTMVDESMDYFSAEKEAEYAEWKACILQRIEARQRSLRSRRDDGIAAT